MSIDEDIPVAVTLTDLEICQAVCEQDQAMKVDDSDGDKCVEENTPTNAEMRQALDILKRGMQHLSTNFKKRIRSMRSYASWSRGDNEQLQLAPSTLSTRR
ncbi:hypothetical protein AVEN_226998-1 [Araneus ventricosus]|uniref:Uncharacterized protein n=1 Tax=Araneus ventricosus TaxID=182803 RepID=A0A4Y2V4Z5_ARAVE|nr:hypothetical protein AVEN_226998-1 [Araneus ventricosus]